MEIQILCHLPPPPPLVSMSLCRRESKSPKVSLWNMRQVVSSQSKTTSAFLSPPMEAEMEDDRPFVLLDMSSATGASFVLDQFPNSWDGIDNQAG